MHCLTNQDITHQFAYTQEIRKEFFDDANNNDSIELNGEKSNEKLNASVLTATDCRLNNNFKILLSKEGNFSVGDIVIFYKIGFRKYKIELVKQTDAKYPIYKQLFTDERHLPLYINDIDGNDFSELNYTPFSAKDKIKSYNRIIFGAPGTGKSHRLNKEAEDYFSAEISKTQEQVVAQEIKNAKNDYSASYAIGLKYADFFKDVKQANEISSKYDCGNKAYTIYQGIRAKNFYDLLPELNYNDDETKIIENIKVQFGKLNSEKYLLQAGAAAIGFKYADFLGGKTKSELNSMFNFKDTTSESGWIKIGIQGASYSFEDDAEQKSTKHFERVTFHPNYSYAQFVGTYKPTMKKVSTDDGEKEEITYSFVVGPFLRVYVNAVNNPNENFLLLIEEINRANVASVFGDVFQLLDRNENGESEYPVAASDDIKKYLKSAGIDQTELSIPANMYIWATMNSADQGVFPMDTAFKRRWNFEYIGIDENESGVSTYKIPINEKSKVNWNELRNAINSKLISLNVNEDKLLGPYFISENDLKNAMEKPKDFIKLFKSKVLMYLFEDAAKMKRDFFKLSDGRKYIYSDICNELDKNGIAVFNFSEDEKGDLEEEEIPKKNQHEVSQETVVSTGSTADPAMTN